MSLDFPAIERIVVEASHRPTNADQKAACSALVTLAPAEKIRVLRLFVERDRRRRAEGRSGDWVPHVYVKGAIGPREVLPWSRDDVEHFLTAIIEETGVLPPTIAVRMVKELGESAPLDAKLQRLVARTAHAMWPDDDGEGVLFRDSAAALRALIGAPTKTKTTKAKAASQKTAKPTPTKTKAAPKTKRAPKASFADAVKRAMERDCPAYRYVSTGGGSGPLVTFARPAPARARHLREHVVFQKGLHGASWFRVNLFATIEGPGANGPMEHTVLEGASLGRDVSFAADAELEAALAAACAGLEAGAAKIFARVEKAYAPLDRLFGGLVAHYTQFLKTDGAKLAPDDFVETEGSNPPTIVAFDAFMRFLGKKKLLVGDKAIDLVTPIWRFWHNGRPMRASDYRKGDYYDCAKCGAFVSFKRGTLAPRRVAGFGTHHAFVCQKHRA